jgi:predicted double-glycine peptidase
MKFSQWLERKKIIPVHDADQKYNFDCGPAALRAIAKLFGRNTSQEKLIDMTDAGKRKGSHPEDLVKAAAKLGMKVVAEKNMSLKTLLGHIKKGRPVICAVQAWAEKGHKDEYAQLKHGHYVVAMGYNSAERLIYFSDPSMHNGHRGKLDYNEFMRRWYDKEAYDKSPHAFQPHLGIVVWDYSQMNPKYNTKPAKKIP